MYAHPGAYNSQQVIVISFNKTIQQNDFIRLYSGVILNCTPRTVNNRNNQDKQRALASVCIKYIHPIPFPTLPSCWQPPTVLFDFPKQTKSQSFPHYAVNGQVCRGEKGRVIFFLLKTIHMYQWIKHCKSPEGKTVHKCGPISLAWLILSRPVSITRGFSAH